MLKPGLFTHLTHYGLNLLSKPVASSWPRRNIFSPSSIGLDRFVAGREKTKSFLASSLPRFREKMAEICQSENQLIFSEDLKNMVAIAEKEDLPLVKKMIKKYDEHNNRVRFGTYVFGPVVMRLFYLLGDSDAALECYKDPDLASFFSQGTSLYILFDLLYEQGRYQDILDAFDIGVKRVENLSFMSNKVTVLVFAACYKLNTPQSFEYAMQLWKELVAINAKQMRRTYSFAAALALAQNAPNYAMEILTSCQSQSFYHIRNLKLKALCDMDRVEDTIPILRSVLEGNDDETKKKCTICRSVLDDVSQAIEKSNNKELKLDYGRIEKFLNDYGHVEDTSLDENICAEIFLPTKEQMQNSRPKSQTVLRASFDKSPSYRRQTSAGRMRPGLSDLY